MSEYSNSVDVDEIVSVGQLFDSIFIIGQRIISHITITEAMIGFPTHWTASTMSDGNHNEP